MDKKDGGTIDLESLRGFTPGPHPDAQPAQGECFCDRMKLGAPGVSCGDCPTRDYAPQPPSIPEPSDADVESALREHFIAVCRSNEEGTVGLKNVGMRAALTTDRARLRAEMGEAIAERDALRARAERAEGRIADAPVASVSMVASNEISGHDDATIMGSYLHGEGANLHDMIGKRVALVVVND